MITDAAAEEVVHDYRIHSNQGVSANSSAVNDRAMAYVCTCLEENRRAREHVNDTRLLHIATILDHDRAPIPAERGAGADVHIPADDDISGYRSLRMNERRRVHDRHGRLPAAAQDGDERRRRDHVRRAVPHPRSAR